MLIAAREEIEQFVSALFRYAEDGTFVSLRAFDQKDRGKPPLLIQGIQVKGDMAEIVAAATSAAERIANTAEPAVFAPPIATFNNPKTARSIDVACGVALTVELDECDPGKAKAKLEALLGPITLAVASGGEWTDLETGEIHNKMHLHWRLSEPTLSAEDHAHLQQARYLAAIYVGGDRTAAPPAHPLRWPGSWNRKGAPRLAMIAAGNPAAEIHLAEALAKLEEAVEAAGLDAAQSGPKISGDPQTPLPLLQSALGALPNADVHWDQWVRVGMAIYRATGGSDGGLEAWEAWSEKSGKHIAGACEERWTHFGKSPPGRIGAGTIYFMAKAEGWQRPLSDHSGPDDSHLQDPNYWASVEADSPSPIEQVAKQAAAAPADTKAIWVKSEAWLEAEIPPRPWVARGYMMRKSVSVVAGTGSAGKSSTGLAWGVSLALCRLWSRFKPTRPEIVSIYNVEDDDDEQRRRLSATLRQFRAAPAQLAQRLYRLGPSNVGTLIARDSMTNKLRFTDAMVELIDHLEAVHPTVLILDPLIALHDADENDNTAIRGIMATLRALAVRFDMAVVLFHHVRKGSSHSAGDPDIIRGAGDIVGAARVVLTVTVMTEDEAKALNVDPVERHAYFRVDGAKQNYAKIEQAEWFRRVEYTLANGETVVAAEPWQPVSGLQSLSPEECNQALDAIAAGPEEGSLYSPTKRGSDNRRWVGQVFSDLFQMTEELAAPIIATWLKTGLLCRVEYYDKAQRKDRTGVQVDHSKRPT